MPRFTDTARYVLVLCGARVPLLLGAAARRSMAPPTVVDVRLSEWKVEVSADTAPAGPVVFRVANAGHLEHAFEVEGRGLEKRSEPIGAGAEGILNVTLKPGRYELYCPVGNGAHQQAGMKTTMTVTAEESAPSSTY
jgi:uncharacterized cupredoxin-like copper-binding protein